MYGFDVESLQLIPMEVSNFRPTQAASESNWGLAFFFSLQSNDTRRELIVGYEDHADLPNLEQYLLQPLTLQCRVRLVSLAYYVIKDVDNIL